MVDIYNDSQIGPIPEFPSLEPLSHDLSLLSPTQTSEFSVDDFLLSRTKASDLNYILKDLRGYSETLKDELFSIINQDYKDFVSLGSALNSESHRIARLGWSSSSSPSSAQASSSAAMAPIRQTLVRSRDTLQSIEDDVRDCMRRRQEAAARKTSLELMLQLHDSVVRLEEMLLIPTSRSARRRSSAATASPSLDYVASGSNPVDSCSDRDDSDYALSSDIDNDDDVDIEAAGVAAPLEDPFSSTSPTASPKASFGNLLGVSPTYSQSIPTKSPSPVATPQTPAQRKKRRKRFSSRPHATPGSPIKTRGAGNLLSPTLSFSRRLSSAGTLGDDHPFLSQDPTSSLLGLPQRVARTSAEYSRLRFLSRRVHKQGLTGFTFAVQDRIDHVRSTLRQDLRALLRALLSPASLLVHGSIKDSPPPSSPERSRRLSRSYSSSSSRRYSSFKLSLSSSRTGGGGTAIEYAHDLDQWSQVAPPVEEGPEGEALYWQDRLQEQRAWLEMVLSALATLGPATSTAALDDQQTSTAIDRHHPQSQSQTKEAEEAVRELMIQKWAAETIISSSLKSQPNGDHESHTAATTPSLPAILAQTVNKASLDSVLLNASDFPLVDPTDPLLVLYNRILTYAAMDASQVCSAAETVSSHLSSSSEDLVPTWSSSSSSPWISPCDVFVNVFFDEVATRLMDDLGGSLFFVGRPDVFYRHYTLSNAFFDCLSLLAPSDRARTALRRHPSWTAFRKRWQLSVYFHMRFRDLVIGLEEGLVAQPATVSVIQLKSTHSGLRDRKQTHDRDGDGGIVENSSSGGDNQVVRPLMKATESTILALLQIWSQGNHLHELAAREWRVFLHILSRYHTWIETQLPDTVLSFLSPHYHSNSNRTSSVSSTEQSRASTPTPTPSSTFSESEIQQLTLLVTLVSDLEIISKSAHYILESIIFPLVLPPSSSSSSSSLPDLLSTTLSQTLSFTIPLFSSLSQSIISLILPKTLQPLRFLRSINSHQQPNNNNLHQQATSPFIFQILKPIQFFLSLPSSTSTCFKRNCCLSILETTLLRYTNSLETIHQNHISLVKLKKSNSFSLFKSSSISSSTDSDFLEKVKNQFLFDLVTFQNQIQALLLDIDFDHWDSWIKLVRVAQGQLD